MRYDREGWNLEVSDEIGCVIRRYIQAKSYIGHVIFLGMFPGRRRSRILVAGCR